MMIWIKRDKDYTFSVLNNNGDITERKKIMKINRGKTWQLIFIMQHLS